MTKLVALCALLFLAGCGLPVSTTESSSSANSGSSTTGFLVSRSFFGMHGHDRGQEDLVPTDLLEFGTFRTVDSPIMWPLLETSRGVFDWSKADVLIAQASRSNVDLVMNLYRTPTWASSAPAQDSAYSENCATVANIGCGNAAPPADIADWDAFVEAFATRYAGSVHYYEIWNEPNLPGTWTGTVEQMVTLAAHAYSIIKRIDPTARVICPSVSNPNTSSWLDLYLRAGGAAYTDIIGFHGYGLTTSPEQISATVVNLKQLAIKYNLTRAELWDTEGSWGQGLDLSSLDKVRWLAVFHLIQGAAGVDRVIWYSYNNGDWGTLTTNPMTPGPYDLNEAGAAYNTLAKWTIGAILKACYRPQPHVWSCSIARPNGYLGWILWSDSGPVFLSPGVTFGTVLSHQRGILTDMAVPIDRLVEVDTLPILVENGAAPMIVDALTLH